MNHLLSADSVLGIISQRYRRLDEILGNFPELQLGPGKIVHRGDPSVHMGPGHAEARRLLLHGVPSLENKDHSSKVARFEYLTKRYTGDSASKWKECSRRVDRFLLTASSSASNRTIYELQLEPQDWLVARAHGTAQFVRMLHCFAAKGPKGTVFLHRTIHLF